MRIREIVTYPDRIENIQKYNQYFTNSQKIPAFGNLLTGRVTTATDEEILALFDRDQIVSILHLNTRDHGMWQITYSQTEPEFQGQGCFRYLLNSAVAVHNTILSDDHQTSLSKKSWQSLIKYPGPNLEIFVYDTRTKKKISSTRVQDKDIWNNKSNPVLMITESNSGLNNTDRDRVMSRLKETTRIDRTEIGLWYGIGTSTTEYYNP